jgi:hypothetical protein
MWGTCAATDDALIMVGGRVSGVHRERQRSESPDHDEELSALRTGLERIRLTLGFVALRSERIAILGDETQHGALGARLFESDSLA